MVHVPAFLHANAPTIRIVVVARYSITSDTRRKYRIRFRCVETRENCVAADPPQGYL
jgi:hypothetical protein